MIKHFLAFVLAAGVCMSASAGYIQYSIHATWNDGNGFDGYFVQDTTDRSVVYYDFVSPGAGATHLVPGTDSLLFNSYTNYYGPGPTSFRIRDTSNAGYSNEISLIFYDYWAGTMVSLWDRADPGGVVGPGSIWRFNDSGSITAGAADPALVAQLDAGVTFVNRDVPLPRPVPVPEPGSLALLLGGVLAAARLRRN